VGRTALTGPQRATLGLACVNIAYVALVVNSLTAGENNRFRFVTDPLSLVLLAVLVDRWLRPRIGPAPFGCMLDGRLRAGTTPGPEGGRR
jgi:hypothetical protein